VFQLRNQKCWKALFQIKISFTNRPAFPNTQINKYKTINESKYNKIMLSKKKQNQILNTFCFNFV
jgi:hypothetical protein